MPGVQRYDKVLQIGRVARFRLYPLYQLTVQDQQRFRTDVSGKNVGDKYWALLYQDHQYPLSNMQRLLQGIIGDWNTKSQTTVLKCGVIDDANKPPKTRFMFATEDRNDANQRNYFWHFFLSDQDEKMFVVNDLSAQLLLK